MLQDQQPIGYYFVYFLGVLILFVMQLVARQLVYGQVLYTTPMKVLDHAHPSVLCK